MELKYKVMFLNFLPFVLLGVPVSVMLYMTYGNPSDKFFEIANTVSAWIFVSPLLILVLACFISMFDDTKVENRSCCKCCCKCNCCNKHH